jgi:hypothetical protein
MPRYFNDDLNFAREALARYGAGLDDADYIVTGGGKVTHVRAIVRRGRLRFEGDGSGLLFSGPPTIAAVDAFVQRYWYWDEPR